MDLVYTYYNNPQMLEKQIECWNSYVGVLRKLPTILLVDDGSPRAPALEVVQRCRCRLPLKVFRIQEDIPWNQPGARNLGCSVAKGWIFVSDMDTLLPSAEAKQLLEKSDLELEQFYLLQRVRHRDLSLLRPSTSAVVFHKKQFLHVGGYDEDYSGHYGKDDRDFLTRMGRHARTKHLTDVVVQAVQRCDIKDASTTDMKRDATWNTALYLKKQAAGFPQIGPRLRFSWERVL